MVFSTLFDGTFYGNSARAWMTALVVFVVVMAVLTILRTVLIRRLGALAGQTTTDLDNFGVGLVRRTHPVFLLLAALTVASLTLALTDVVRGRIRVVFVAALIIQASFWGNDLIAFGARRLGRSQGGAGGQSTVTAMVFAGRLVLWVVLILLLLQNFGVQVTALITTLGIGGVAVALAAQSVLADLLAAVSIYLDKPFLIGDFIIFDDLLGSVEYVGLRSTHIQSLYGEQIIISNSDLLKSRIHNYKRMAERRVTFQIGVAYGTPADAVARIPGMIRAAVEAQERVRFDRSHFAGYGDSSLNFETVFYVLSPDYTLYMDIQQAINLVIMRQFEAEGIAFAHPVRVVTVHGNGRSVPSLGMGDAEARERIGQ